MAYKNFKKTEIVDEIGMELRSVRNTRNLTLAQVSDALAQRGTQVSGIMLGRIETGQRRIDDDLLEALCSFYGVDSDEVVRKACQAHLAALDPPVCWDHLEEDMLALVDNFSRLPQHRQEDVFNIIRMFLEQEEEYHDMVGMDGRLPTPREDMREYLAEYGDKLDNATLKKIVEENSEPFDINKYLQDPEAEETGSGEDAEGGTEADDDTVAEASTDIDVEFDAGSGNEVDAGTDNEAGAGVDTEASAGTGNEADTTSSGSHNEANKDAANDNKSDDNPATIIRSRRLPSHLL